MRRFSLIIVLLAFSDFLFGQISIEKEKPSLKVELDLYSAHLWRGFKNGTSFSIQPTLTGEYKGVSLGAWAAYAGDDSYFEVDLFAEYRYRNITFSIYDYYCPANTQVKDFIEFRKQRTKHTIDVMFLWEPAQIPFKILFSTMALGDDLNEVGNQAYSTYIEPAFVWEWRNFSGEVLAGVTPFKGYYARKFSFINLGSVLCYNLKMNEFELPFQTKTSYNPILNSFFYTFGVSLTI